MLTTIVILIPKGSSGDFQSIGLLKVVWKVIKHVINARRKCVPLHDALHGFRPGHSWGTGIMEVKLAQQLASVEQCPFYGIFLDLKKAYDAMDRDRCLNILRNVGVGENTVRLISRFWWDGLLACSAAGFYGALFRARRGVTQGGPLLPTIFNLMVDAVICEWERQLIEKGLGFDDVRRLFACFYADSGLIAARNPEHLQLAFNLLTALFDWVGLMTNTLKTESMVFLPERIRTCLTEGAYRSKMGPSQRVPNKGRRVRCQLCNKEFAATYLAKHLEVQHNVRHAYLQEEEVCTLAPRKFEAIPPWWMPSGGAPCPTARKDRRGQGAPPTTTCGGTLASGTCRTRSGLEGRAPCAARCAWCRRGRRAPPRTSTLGSARTWWPSASARRWRGRQRRRRANNFGPTNGTPSAMRSYGACRPSNTWVASWPMTTATRQPSGSISSRQGWCGGGYHKRPPPPGLRPLFTGRAPHGWHGAVKGRRPLRPAGGQRIPWTWTRGCGAFYERKTLARGSRARE